MELDVFMRGGFWLKIRNFDCDHYPSAVNTKPLRAA